MYVRKSTTAESHTPAPAAGWEEMTPGTRVEIHANGQRIGRGTIDEFMPDGSIVWFWLDGGLGRQLVHVDDAVRLQAVARPDGPISNGRGE